MFEKKIVIPTRTMKYIIDARDIVDPIVAIKLYFVYKTG